MSPDRASDPIEVAYLADGAVAMRNAAHPEDPPLRYTAAEWKAFTLGVRDGEFDVEAQPDVQMSCCSMYDVGE
ncbi:DUF397 domain-containing protein [Streptomyces sp. 3N207]|uniref:DUF397 domain-containing protein n=1 Tax=Streptomyces sp. 3N207 TaxID=3457417 RepID=UPI003FD5EB7C